MPCGLANNLSWKLRLSLASLLLASVSLADPSPISDEGFLLFLADSVEENGELIDPLSMIEQIEEQRIENEASSSITESDDTEANNE